MLSSSLIRNIIFKIVADIVISLESSDVLVQQANYDKKGPAEFFS